VDLGQLLTLVGDSKVEDWVMITRPTFRHHFEPQYDDKGELVNVSVDEHKVLLAYAADVSVTMGYGMVKDAGYRIAPPHPFSNENARAEQLDVFHRGILVFREVLIRADGHRCILPEASDWTKPPIKVPKRKARLARLVHILAGPLTDFDQYFKDAQMVEVDAPWPS
jgi:hypothetical protein